MRCLEMIRDTSRRLRAPALAVFVGASVLSCPLLFAQADLLNQEWPTYGEDASSGKFVPLEQIHQGNVADMHIAWSWETPDNAIFRNDERATAGEYKSTPIMVNGTLYVSTSVGHVAAINAITGEQPWVFDTGSWEKGRHPNFNNNHRGVSWWNDGTDGRIFMAANDGLLWSVNARTGEPDMSFGEQGYIVLKQVLGRDTRIGLYGAISPPMIVNDVVVVGSSISDGPLFQDQLPPGHVRGFDATTGEIVWHL